MMLSVIIPIYNSEHSLRRCLDSLVSQEFKDYELILIDDGSKDSSLAICEDYAKSNPLIKILKQSNRGAAAARNNGIGYASGEYIAFVDSDDWVESDYLSKINKYCAELDFDVLWFNYQCISEDGRLLFKSTNQNGILSQREYLSCFYGMNLGVGSMCTRVFRRSFIEYYDVRLTEGRIYGEDWEFNLKTALNNPKVVMCQDVLYNYVKYTSDKTVSTRYYPSDFGTFTDSYLRLLQIAQDYNLECSKEEQDSLYLYNCISLLYKLQKSTIEKEKKIGEFKTIVSNDVFKSVLDGNNWDGRYMSKRQRVVARMLKYRFYKLAQFVLNL